MYKHSPLRQYLNKKVLRATTTAQPITTTSSSSNIHADSILYKHQLSQIEKINEYTQVASSIPAALQDLAKLIAGSKQQLLKNLQI